MTRAHYVIFSISFMVFLGIAVHLIIQTKNISETSYNQELLLAKCNAVLEDCIRNGKSNTNDTEETTLILDCYEKHVDEIGEVVTEMYTKQPDNNFLQKSMLFYLIMAEKYEKAVSFHMSHMSEPNNIFDLMLTDAIPGSEIQCYPYCVEVTKRKLERFTELLVEKTGKESFFFVD